ncbi:FAR-RED IMPAIRED RESPONSIVE (FAR1) FAMILY PROTEIN-RELATED [Salix koriyanagi]|uniref:FAR-RED IMPAIRED RESPONSIVE (FAR1) FAMILY PROTEIN-RELATED n=1 Tax=Salix koriyanagi TaxID=2511006 RepID=A0A9Q0UPW0_9ROSI|nr:FAR-RED IMPAIRED RESPONSIVE (FAR1) FAMILY PROTEIN-RELATED [Salix koriyanagi]
MARIPGCTSIAQDVLKVITNIDLWYAHLVTVCQFVEIETLVEDKIVTTESIVGGETGACEVDTSQEPYEGMVFESEKSARVFYDEYAKREGFLTRIVSSRRPTPDEKDERIRELSSQLHHTNRQLAACREQLRTFMTYIEEHTMCMLKTVEGVVQNIREVESETRSSS